VSITRGSGLDVSVAFIGNEVDYAVTTPGNWQDKRGADRCE
jgi:hypothetical protein